MKIICIGRNYGAHAHELGNDVPDEPVFFLKPETAILPADVPFKIPSWSREIHYEIELVLRINRLCSGENVKKLAHFVDRINIGLDLTARDVQDQLKKKGLPWEKAKAFDGSAVLGDWFLHLPKDLDAISFSLEKNGTVVQQGSSKDMIFSFTELLTHVSRYITLEPDDLIFTGTPAGVGAVSPGDRLIGKLDGDPLIDLHIEA